MTRIRLRLTGAIAFVSSIYGQLIGLLFSILIARRLAPDVFGSWAYIGFLISYSLIPFNLINSWIARDSARGRKVQVPVLIASSFLFPPSVIIYLAVAYYTHSQIATDLSVLLLGLLVLIPNSLVNLYAAIVTGYAPHLQVVGSMLFETVKLLVAVALVLGLKDVSLNAAILSVSLGYIAYLMFLVVIARETLGPEDIRGALGRWLRGSVLSGVAIAVYTFYGLDILLISIFTGGTLITGYWQAALIVSSLINAPSLLIGALFQRLLAGGDMRDASKSLHFTLTLAVPLFFGIVVLSDYLLSILNPLYAEVWPVASILAATTFVSIVYTFYTTIISATETIDQTGVPRLREYLRSRIAFTIYVMGATVPVYLVPILVILTTFEGPPSLTLTAIASVKLLVTSLQTMIYYLYVRRHVRLSISTREVVPYFSSSLAMMSVILTVKQMLGPPAPQLFSTLADFGALALIGASVYFPLLYATSGRFRSLVRDLRAFFQGILRGPGL
ncbi:MAG: hypothetical protein NZ920_02735 [Aigarchaeota archaeon]|nr:hypothetical protein [Aigarchaeota archaeon]MDW8092460.1 hypothetical protein [Nitrososphaerota archaeon]